jgi:hypothetical protein
MNRIKAAIIVYLLSMTPAMAAYTPIYVGMQVDNTSGRVLLGYQIDKAYAVEAHYTKTSINTSHAGITADTDIDAVGVSALLQFPAKLSGGSPYIVFAKLGYERRNKEDSYTVPLSVTFTVPYRDSVKNVENLAVAGVGVQYNFYSGLSGRAGIDIVGNEPSVYLGAIFKF